MRKSKVNANYNAQRTRLYDYILDQGYTGIKDFWNKTNLSDKLSYNTLYGWCNDTTHCNNAKRDEPRKYAELVMVGNVLNISYQEVLNLILSRGRDSARENKPHHFTGSNKLKELRIAANLTAAETAELVGCSRNVIISIENGKQKNFKDVKQLTAYLELFDISFHEFQDVVNSIYIGPVRKTDKKEDKTMNSKEIKINERNQTIEKIETYSCEDLGNSRIAIDLDIQESPVRPLREDHILEDNDIDIILDTVYGRISRKTYIRLENVLKRYMQ